MPSRALLDAASEAYGLGIDQNDWGPLRGLYHPEALLDTAAKPGVPVRPDEFFADPEALRRFYMVGPRVVVPLDEQAGLVQAQLRSPNPGGGFRTVERIWLLTFREGLIYRQRNLSSAGEAEALYARHGLDLGMVAEH